MDRLAVLVTLAPSPAGNGLARRAWQFVAAARQTFEVLVCVVPTAGVEVYRDEHHEPDIPTVTVPVQSEPGVLGAELVVEAPWPHRLAASLPWPESAGLVPPPTLAVEAVEKLSRAGVESGTPVHAMRLTLAPLAVAVAELLGSRWRSLDLDDDDATLAASLGSGAEAAAFDRLLATFGPLFDALCTAAPLEAAGIAQRHGLRVSVVRNAAPGGPWVRAPGERPELLFVGNLDYGPNIAAARHLAREVLPIVAQKLRRPVDLLLVGPYDPNGPVAELGRIPGVTLTGYLADLTPPYARAAAVVAPMTHGAGTSLKVLEAFAREVPVVTTRTGCRGLGVAGGHHLLLGETPAELAGEVVRLLRDPALGRSLAAAARDFVETQHSEAAASADVHTLFARAREESATVR